LSFIVFVIYFPTLRLVACVQMTPEERAEMDRICSQIQEEKDPKKFDELVARLNELLEDKGHRLTEKQRKAKSS